MVVEIVPAFNYARDEHKVIDWPTTGISGPGTLTVVFGNENTRFKVDIHLEADDRSKEGPSVGFQLYDKGLGGKGVCANLKLAANQRVTFITDSGQSGIPQDNLGQYIKTLERTTSEFWSGWAKKCTFRGHHPEQVERSLLVLKLLTYQPTGAIIAAPTFSLPESISGGRNWDYRYSWVRDTSFISYAFLENGYIEEAEAYMKFVYNRIIPSISRKAVVTSNKQVFPIVLSILEVPEIELPAFGWISGKSACQNWQRSNLAYPTGHIRCAAR